MEYQGNCGRSARWYGDELSVLYGRLTSDEDYVVTVPTYDRKVHQPKRCEHGVLLKKQCPTCAFMFGWEARDNGT